NAFQLPFRPKSFDFVFSSLFLHHFNEQEVVCLLSNFGAIARRAVLINDLERNLLAYYFLPLTRWLFRWDPITLHDGPISVRASFRASELSELARRSGLRVAKIEVHRPAFRIGLVAEPSRLS
ncbi:MAG TPA: methyltransferase domain-containing protein, partial [Bryobacteraceae bacterium]|nr:methyltransferase domain-containing protein [Bryobacteraceae bacterium]